MKKQCFWDGLMGAAILDLARTSFAHDGSCRQGDSGEKTSCFVDVCNGNLTLWTYLGIKLIEIDTYDVYST